MIIEINNLLDELNSTIYTGEENIKSEGNAQSVMHRDRAVNMKERVNHMEDIMRKCSTSNWSSRKKK